MISYCLKYRKNTNSKTLKVVKTKKGMLFLSNCAVCSSTKSRFNKEQEPIRLFTSLIGAKSLFEGISLLCSIV